MQKIVPHLWFDKQAREAVDLYVRLFDNSKMMFSLIVEGTPSGDAESISFSLQGQDFLAISAGPYFKFNPSVSLFVSCKSVEDINAKWTELSKNGKILMELGEYPFNKYYGWVEDRYGLSWQLMIADDDQGSQRIVPNLLFSNGVCGRAEEAIQFYLDVFEDAKVNFVSNYTAGEPHTSKAKTNYASFDIRGMKFSAMDNAYDVDYTFNEALSFIVYCADQTEIDYYWDRLSAVPEAEQCGWLKDKFGVSWQIIPYELDEMMLSPSKDKVKKVTEVFLEMKKLDLSELRKAFGTD